MLYDPKWEKDLEVKPTEPWRDVLLRAADLIRRRGLAKGIREDMSGAMCVHGAISQVLYGTPHGDSGCDYIKSREYEVAVHLYDYLKANHGYVGFLAMRGNCAAWNNMPSRTKEEVIAALEDCARS